MRILCQTLRSLRKKKAYLLLLTVQYPHYTVEQTSDAFADPFIIRDNSIPEGQDGQYYDVGGIYQTFETEEEAQEYADTLNSAENNVNLFAQKDAERSRQEQDTSDLIGKEIVIDNRRYLIESVGKVSDDVSMRDITFKDSVGFPINRVEKIGYIRSLLEQEQPELPPEEKAEKSAVPSALRHNYRITEDTLGVGGAKKSSITIWRQSTFCTNWSLKTVLPRPKNKKPFQNMLVGAVCQWRLTRITQRGQTSFQELLRKPVARGIPCGDGVHFDGVLYAARCD